MELKWNCCRIFCNIYFIHKILRFFMIQDISRRLGWMGSSVDSILCCQQSLGGQQAKCSIDSWESENCAPLRCAKRTPFNFCAIHLSYRTRALLLYNLSGLWPNNFSGLSLKTISWEEVMLFLSWKGILILLREIQSDSARGRKSFGFIITLYNFYLINFSNIKRFWLSSWKNH